MTIHKPLTLRRCATALAAGLVLLSGPATRTFADDASDAYRKACAPCHGEGGGGDGPAARYLDPRPRDFTRGLFKIRSTRGGELPTDQDLFDVITRGIPGTSMPGWQGLTVGERWSLVDYIKSFCSDFAAAEAPPAELDMRGQVPYSEQSAAAGRELFLEFKCADCHGETGRGDGASAPGLTDDWGAPIRAGDLSKGWRLKGGEAPGDIYRRILGGMLGTPMPSFAESFALDPEIQEIGYAIEDGERVSTDARQRYEAAMAEMRQQSWHLANYVRSLSRPEGLFHKLFLSDTELTR